MSSGSGNLNVYIEVLVGGKVCVPSGRHQMNFHGVPFEDLVKTIQDLPHTASDRPHFLAESITMSINHREVPFSSDTRFAEIIYDKSGKPKKEMNISFTMDATIVPKKALKLSDKFSSSSSGLPTPKRAVFGGSSRPQSTSNITKGATAGGKCNGNGRASTMTMGTSTPAKKKQNAPDLPAVPVSAVKPTPATTFISIGASKAQKPETNEDTEQNAECFPSRDISDASVLIPPLGAVVGAESDTQVVTETEEETVETLAVTTVAEADTSMSLAEQESVPSVDVVVEAAVAEVSAVEAVSNTTFTSTPTALNVAPVAPMAVKRVLGKKSSERKKFRGPKTIKLRGDNGESEGEETAEGSNSDSDDEEEDERDIVAETQCAAAVSAGQVFSVDVPVIAAPEPVPVADPAAEVGCDDSSVVVVEEKVEAPIVAVVDKEVHQEDEGENHSPLKSTGTDVTHTTSNNNPCKTPEKTRAVSNPRGGYRASVLVKPTISSTRKDNKSACKRQSTYTPSTPLYDGGVTAAEGKLKFENSLHRTTGSMFTSHSSAAFNPNASLGSATKMPRSTPAKKAAPAKSTNSTTTAQELSPIRMTVPRSGRPSIGTIETQWEYMRSNFFNNDDEEIQWAMVSKKRGAYAHAHQKYGKAEDHYFQCIHIIAENEGKIESIKSGLAAQIISILKVLASICVECERLGYIADVPELYKTQLEKLKKLSESVTDQDFAFNCFCKTTKDELERLYNKPENWDKDAKSSLRSARRMFNRLDNEEKLLVHALTKAQEKSEHALEYMEKWSRREKGALDYDETMRNEIEDWLVENDAANYDAYNEMRTFVPVNISELQVADLMRLSREKGGCLSLELATEIKQNKLLHWIVTHPEDIATDSFLTGDKKAFFENLEALDIVEMRALAYHLPGKFENDKDGKKNEWRARFFARVRQMASQQQGVLVKGAYCSVAQTRQMVAQPALKPEQKRRAVYFYRTKEKSLIKIKQYTDRIALLARRENAVVAGRTAVQESKAEYDVLLGESRDPAFIKEYGLEVLTEMKDVAKREWQTAVSTLKCAEQDLSNLHKTIESMPLTFDQYKEQEDELVAFLANQENPVDWNQRGLAAQPVICGFEDYEEIHKAVKVGLKFVSAEEEAAQRRADLDALVARKNDIAAAFETMAEGDAETVPCTVPGTPCADDSNSGTATAPNTEFKKLSAAALGIFSPTTTRAQSEYSLNCLASNASAAAGSGTPFETPRKRNSVLLNANPEMLNTLNKMLMSSPAATPLKNSRQSLFGAASASKFAAKNSAAADGDESTAAPDVRPVTRSKLLMRKLTPHGLLGASGVSPKRSAPMPKLSFLAQLTNRAKKADSSEDADNATATAAPSAPVVRPPMSMFAEIAKFRKSEEEESGETKVKVKGADVKLGVSGDEEGAAAVSGEKENSSALDNVEATRPVSSAFKKSSSSSSSSTAMMGMMMGGPSGALKMPMMSMFDEIRKRRKE